MSDHRQAAAHRCRVVVVDDDGETEDAFLADLAVGLGAVAARVGSPFGYDQVSCPHLSRHALVRCPFTRNVFVCNLAVAAVQTTSSSTIGCCVPRTKLGCTPSALGLPFWNKHEFLGEKGGKGGKKARGAKKAFQPKFDPRYARKTRSLKRLVMQEPERLRVLVSSDLQQLRKDGQKERKEQAGHQGNGRRWCVAEERIYARNPDHHDEDGQLRLQTQMPPRRR